MTLGTVCSISQLDMPLSIGVSPLEYKLQEKFLQNCRLRLVVQLVWSKI
jgi:hypothetical protein